jgi:hypothetical protein
MDWLEPWLAVEGDEKQRLTQEVQKEVRAGHLLHGGPAVVVGRSMASDDVLVQLHQQEHQYAVVHLVWQQSNRADWPHTVFFADWNAFAQLRMTPDNAHY